MRMTCPRCDTSMTPRDRECGSCGYRPVVSCAVCGKANIPHAAFCGTCGSGMTFGSRIRQRWERAVPLRMRQQMQQIGAGFVFGGLLTFFAFGSMGMVRPDAHRVQPVSEPSPAQSGLFASPTANQAAAELQRLEQAGEPERAATLADLLRVGDILINTFAQTLNPSGKDGMPLESSRYLATLNTKTGTPRQTLLQRGDAAVFFFHVTNDLFAWQPPDNPTYRYGDIPRYHFLNVPAETLDAMGIRISRTEETFGGEDSLTVMNLSRISLDLIRACENRLKSRAFPPLDPAG